MYCWHRIQLHEVDLKPVTSILGMPHEISTLGITQIFCDEARNGDVATGYM
jgi:hypothetical protein